MQEGIIKFNCEWLNKKPLPANQLKEIIFWRNKLFKLKLICAGKDGIGYGNISIRHRKEQFIISGSQTGIKKIADENDFTLITEFNISKNYIKCEGTVKASSESLTHAAIYSALPEINAVIHVHDKEAWNKFKNKMPTTSESAEYGTPKLAQEIFRLSKSPEIFNTKIIILAGHEDGIISFGKSLDEAFNLLISQTKDI